MVTDSELRALFLNYFYKRGCKDSLINDWFNNTYSYGDYVFGQGDTYYWYQQLTNTVAPKPPVKERRVINA